MAKGHKRQCKLHGCGTLLSQYNSGPYCFIHETMKLMEDCEEEDQGKIDYMHKFYLDRKRRGYYANK